MLERHNLTSTGPQVHQNLPPNKIFSLIKYIIISTDLDDCNLLENSENWDFDLGGVNLILGHPKKRTRTLILGHGTNNLKNLKDN